MGKIKIKNKELLIRIIKTISWLDECRWNKEDNEDNNFINFFRDDLTNCEKYSHIGLVILQIDKYHLKSFEIKEEAFF